VKRGRHLRILERDTPVADLVPIEQDAGGVDDGVHLAQLERKGSSGEAARELCQPSSSNADQAIRQGRSGPR
jgi:antitoxin (DNA-binding transcriptional repressor) of toxin-antitoxin stability system